MLYKIDLGKQHQEEINVIIRLPGSAANDLHLSFRLNDGQKRPITTPPTVATALELPDCQDSLACLIKRLVADGRATHAGKYKKGSGKIPLFRGESSDGLYVDSVDKKTGQNLLKGIHLRNPDKVKKLAQWVVGKFPVVSEWAGVSYTTSPHSEQELAYIIVMAARCINGNQSIRLFQHG